MCPDEPFGSVSNNQHATIVGDCVIVSKSLHFPSSMLKPIPEVFELKQEPKAFPKRSVFDTEWYINIRYIKWRILKLVWRMNNTVHCDDWFSVQASFSDLISYVENLPFRSSLACTCAWRCLQTPVPQQRFDGSFTFPNGFSGGICFSKIAALYKERTV